MPINRKQSPLRPLPMRITDLQWERLQALRAYDAISIQEHVRRALDEYLDAVEFRRLQTSPSGRRPGDSPAQRGKSPPVEPDEASVQELPQFVTAGAEPTKRRRVVYR